MADVYVKIGALGRQIEAVDAEIADLVRKRGEFERELKELAATLMVSTVFTPISFPDAPPSNPDQHEEMPPRFAKILNLVVKHPGADIRQLARQIYGNGEKTSRINVSSDLSRLKSEGLVQPIKRGVFQITERGRAVLNGGHR